jgi:cystathionine gamma-lyase
MQENDSLSFGTLAVHAGVTPDPVSGAIMTPIYQTSTYVQEGIGRHKGYEYARTQNPTRDALQASLAALENGKFGICFSSGLAAVDSVIKMLNPGDEVLSTDDLYGGTYRLFRTVFEKYGIKFNFIGTDSPEEVEKHITPHTKLVWIETPTNPMLKISDIAGISAVCKKHGVLLAVDNTFATPYLQRPLELGADIVMHSVTKYLGGHSDVIMGALVVRDQALATEFYRLQNSCGAVPGPQDCFLVLRGVKTLHLRMEAHSRNARAVAEFLRSHPAVERVVWPGFADHPNHDVAARQMRHFGGMLSFTLKDDRIEAAHSLLGKLKLFSLAESLGGVESLVGHPATMTHASIPRQDRLKNGLTDSLIRLSVGVEDSEDLVADLRNALPQS